MRMGARKGAGGVTDRKQYGPLRNVTGFTNFEYATGGKWLELLKEAGRRAISWPARFARAP